MYKLTMAGFEPHYLWCQKRPLYQLSHNRCPTNIFVKLPATAQVSGTYFRYQHLSDLNQRVPIFFAR